MGLSLPGPHSLPGQRWWPSANCLMISKPVLLPCLPFLTGHLPKQSLGLAKVQSSFAAGAKNLLLWKPGRELLVASTACSVPIASKVHRVGCQRSSFILTTLVASPAARNSLWYQTTEGPGSKLASFCLISQALSSQQTKQGW